MERQLNAWFVPGRTAGKRIGWWLARMEAEADAFADEKGRDAFAFEPIESRYLEAVPPFERAIGTRAGVIIFTDTQGELANSEVVNTFYFEPPPAEEYVWAAWRPGSLEELVTTWPARTPPGEREVARGWWVPDLDELRVARQKARSKRRAEQRRQGD